MRGCYAHSKSLLTFALGWKVFDPNRLLLSFFSFIITAIELLNGNDMVPFVSGGSSVILSIEFCAAFSPDQEWECGSVYRDIGMTKTDCRTSHCCCSPWQLSYPSHGTMPSTDWSCGSWVNTFGEEDSVNKCGKLLPGWCILKLDEQLLFFSMFNK